MKAKVKTWLQEIENGNIKTKTAQIYDMICRNRGINTYDLRLHSGIKHQSLTSIVSTLMDEGLVKVIGQTQIGSHHYSSYDKVDPMYINHYKLERIREKFRQWLKRSDDFIEFVDYDTKILIEKLTDKYVIKW